MIVSFLSVYLLLLGEERGGKSKTDSVVCRVDRVAWGHADYYVDTRWTYVI